MTLGMLRERMQMDAMRMIRLDYPRAAIREYQSHIRTLVDALSKEKNVRVERVLFMPTSTRFTSPEVIREFKILDTWIADFEKSEKSHTKKFRIKSLSQSLR